jgi:hypothetical protein
MSSECPERYPYVLDGFPEIPQIYFSPRSAMDLEQ